MDKDGNGHICYPEFSAMLRSELDYQGPEWTLHSLWKAIDTDNSGFILEGEFGKFWRRGTFAFVHARSNEIHERRIQEKRRLKLARQEKDRIHYKERAIEAAYASLVLEQKAAAMEDDLWAYVKETTTSPSRS